MEKTYSDVNINSLMQFTKLKSFSLLALASISAHTILICVIAAFLGIQYPGATAGHAGSSSISVADSRTLPFHRLMTPWPSLQLNPHSLLIIEFALFGSCLAWLGSSCQLDTVGSRSRCVFCPGRPFSALPFGKLTANQEHNCTGSSCCNSTAMNKSLGERVSELLK